jgi:hypothetical protein
VSGEKLAYAAIGLASAASILIAALYWDSLFGGVPGWLTVLLRIGGGFAIGAAYAVLVLLPLQLLLPALEITASDSTRSRSVIKWAIPGLPALVSLGALVVKL